MRDYTETDGTVAGNSGAALEADADDHDGKTLRDGAEYASLTRRAATDNSRALVDDVLRLITEGEVRKRQRGPKADASFRQAAEGYLGDLLAATGEEWIYRPVGRSTFTDGAITYRNFTAVREGLRKLVLRRHCLLV